MSKFKYIYLYTNLAIISFGMMVGGYWLLRPYNVIEIKNSNEVSVDREVYQAGDRITYTFDYCKKIKAAAIIQRQLVDGIRINYNPVYNNLLADKVGVACANLKNSDLVIPDSASSGKWHIEASVEYRVNPIRTVTVFWRSVDFQIENSQLEKVKENTADIEKNTADIKNLK